MPGPFVSVHGRRFGFDNRGVLHDNRYIGDPFHRGRDWFVNAKFGNDGHDGFSYDTALATVGEVFGRADTARDGFHSGDRIWIAGKVREQLETPEGVFDVSVIGLGNRPRHADDHTEPSGGGYHGGSGAATWTAPASGSTANPLLIVQQQGWRVYGLTWQLSGSATACVLLHKTDDSGDDERDGAHAELIYNKFQGDPASPAGIGVQTNGVGFFKLEDNLLLGFATAIAKTGSAGGQVGWGEINNNRFSDNTNGIVSPLYRFALRGNHFMADHTVEFDLSSGNDNVWDGNIFAGNDAFETNIAGTGDFIVGRNWALDTGSADVDAAGLVTAAPDGS